MVLEMAGLIKDSTEVDSLRYELKASEEKLKEKDELLQSIIQTTVPAPKYQELAANLDASSREALSLKEIVGDLQKMVCKMVNTYLGLAYVTLGRSVPISSSHAYLFY